MPALDVNALLEAFRHVPGFGNNKVLKRHTGTGRVEWQSLSTGDLPAHALLGAQHSDATTSTVTRGDLMYGNTTPAWDDLAIGGGNTVLKSDGVDPSWGTINALHIDSRTRHINIVLHDQTGASSLPDVDVHGAFSGLPHWDVADGVTTTIRSLGMVAMPADYVAGTATLKFYWSSSVASNNVRFAVQIREITDNVTADTTRMAGTGTTQAAPGVADTIETFSEDTTSNITAGAAVAVAIARVGGDAADTNTGTVSIWAAWIVYTADM